MAFNFRIQAGWDTGEKKKKGGDDDDDSSSSYTYTETEDGDESSATDATEEATSPQKPQESQQQPPPKTQPLPTADLRFSPIPSGDKTGRQLIVMRHGERVDRIFPGWTTKAFADGRYHPYDLNLPLKMPKRELTDFHNDTPMTEIGCVASQMIGRGMRVAKAIPVQVVCSPALRCIQTAMNTLKGMGAPTDGSDSRFVIKVEPALFEWLGDYKQMPVFLSNDELKKEGYPIDPSYTPMTQVEELATRTKETADDCYRRYAEAAQQLVAKSEPNGLTLIVAHATTLDAACRPLMGKSTTTTNMHHHGLKFPYCSMVALEELKSNNAWRVMTNVLKPITSSDFNNRIDAFYFNRAQ